MFVEWRRVSACEGRGTAVLLRLKSRMFLTANLSFIHHFQEELIGCRTRYAASSCTERQARMRGVPRWHMGQRRSIACFCCGARTAMGGWGRIDGSEVLTAKREGLRAIAVG